MRTACRKWLVCAVALAFTAAAAVRAAEGAAPGSANPVGAVSNIKVLSDKVPNVSSLEAWKKSFIKEGMSDKEKALAIFRTEVTFQQADAPPNEYLQREDAVLDPIKLFNVYGYTLCSVSSANMMCLAHYVGLPARCFTINNHVVPEFFYDNAWHMFDADLIEYFPKADGSIASLQEIVDEVGKWKAAHPEYAAINKSNRYAYMAKPGWKTGPEILLRNPYYDDNGWLPCAEFAWGDTMLQFGRINNNWQSCYSMGYRVNVDSARGRSSRATGSTRACTSTWTAARRRARSRPRSASSRSATRPNGATSPPAASATASWNTTCPWPPACSAARPSGPTTWPPLPKAAARPCTSRTPSARASSIFACLPATSTSAAS